MDNTVGNFGSLYLGVNNKAVRKLRDFLVLSPRQKSLIYGTLLGDGSVYGNGRKDGKNHRLQVVHTEKQKDLVLWKYKVLKNFVLDPPKYVPQNNSWRFRTISHPEITKIHRLFYRNTKKILPENIKEILNDKLSLAVWFMDDGCRWVSKNRQMGLILNTQNFSFSEVTKLVRLFNQFHGINPRIHRDHNRFRLHIRVEDQYKFSDLINKHIINALRYKLPRYP